MPTTFQASHRYAKTTARKARLVVDLIRGLPVNRALTVLDRSPRRAAVLVGKVVRSAVANAEQDAHVDPNRLVVTEARVDEGPLLGGFMRWRPGARGRAMPIRKRTSHIRIKLAVPVSDKTATQTKTDETTADPPETAKGKRGGKQSDTAKAQAADAKPGKSDTATKTPKTAKTGKTGKNPKAGKGD
jgi:large subunit ribosomal protein L22